MNERTVIRLWKAQVPLDRIAWRLGKTLNETYYLVLVYLDGEKNPPPHVFDWKR